MVFVEVRKPGGKEVGSGVLLHADGFVATAAHVVEMASSIEVSFVDGSRMAAEVVTLSRSEDLALLKIPRVPEGAYIAALADSDRLRVGQRVYCIGAPLGLRHTLTTGIVSAMRTDHGDEMSLLPRTVVQTDAAINQGNSGGALFDEQGRVVGIASFIATQSGGSVGLGFAVPSNIVRERLFTGAIPYMGLILRRIPAPLAELLHWPHPDALLVERVAPGSPAAKAGFVGGYVATDFSGVKVLMGGDLIVGVAELPIARADAVKELLTKLEDGAVIKYHILRAGRPMELPVTVVAQHPIPKI